VNCRETEDLLSTYKDGGLALAQGVEVEAHLRHCPACTAHLQDMRVASRPRRWPLLLLAAAACVAAFWILGTR
jgi:anti-sigma factor RsiW